MIKSSLHGVLLNRTNVPCHGWTPENFHTLVNEAVPCVYWLERGRHCVRGGFSRCVSLACFFFFGARYPRFSKKIRVEEEKSSVVREMKFIKVRDKDWRTAKWKNVKMKMNMGEWIHSRLWIILCCYYYTSTHTWNYFYYLSISTTPRKRFVVYMEKSLSFIFWLFFDYFLIIFIFFVINI